MKNTPSGRDRSLTTWEWVAWLAGVGVVTALFVPVRDRLDDVYAALAYLLVVQLATARGGRPLGFTSAGLAFLCFDFFLLPPYGTLRVETPLDWFVLSAFLATSLVAASLLDRARREAARARAHADEVERLSAEAARARTLQEAHRAKDALLASVSHDLRTPLTSIRALAQELADGGDERAIAIAEEAERLERFVSDMLDLSRIASGMVPLDVQPNEAEDLVGAAAQRIAARLDGRPLHIAVQPSDALLFGRFDFVHTLRALVNLLENAAKYSPAGSAIDLTARRDGATLVFAVADRGAGIPDAERERIFDPFYRPDGTPPDVGGLGLGLSIARGMMQAQGATLDYAPRPGGGSVFEIRMPAVDVEDLAREGSATGG